MSPDEYCQQKTVQSGSSFYYSFLFLPPERRRAITALYAFCREVDDTVDEATDASVARIKLAWWRTEVSTMYKGTPTHPVMLALQPHVAVYRPEEATSAGHHRRHGDGPRPEPLPRLSRPAASIAGMWRAWSASCRPAFSATRIRKPWTTPKSWAWPSSSPISSATSAKTRARAASTCRSTSCSSSASPRHDLLNAPPQREVRGADALPGRARASHVRRGARAAAESKTGAPSVRA